VAQQFTQRENLFPTASEGANRQLHTRSDLWEAGQVLEGPHLDLDGTLDGKPAWGSCIARLPQVLAAAYN
jgi:hypothetical protein